MDTVALLAEIGILKDRLAEAEKIDRSCPVHEDLRLLCSELDAKVRKAESRVVEAEKERDEWKKKERAKYAELIRVSSQFMSKEDALLKKVADVEKRGGEGCPCSWVTPCSSNCTCAVPVMSGGCQRCCRYGSKEQQKAMAVLLSNVEKSAEVDQKLLDRAIGYLVVLDFDQDLPSTWVGIRDLIREYRKVVKAQKKGTATKAEKDSRDALAVLVILWTDFKTGALEQERLPMLWNALWKYGERRPDWYEEATKEQNDDC